jgi:hypothetical protein
MPILGIIASSKLTAVPNSYESIATVTVGSGGQSDITFSSIPSGFKHLQIRGISNASSFADETVRAQFNGDTGSNYSWHTLYGSGTGAFSDFNGVSSTYVGNFARTGDSSSIFGASIVDILDYDNTNKYKTVRSLAGQDSNGSGIIWLSSASWRNTNAITSIKIFPATGSFEQYTQFALYGIKGA